MLDFRRFGGVRVQREQHLVSLDGFGKFLFLVEVGVPDPLDDFETVIAVANVLEELCRALRTTKIHEAETDVLHGLGLQSRIADLVFRIVPVGQIDVVRQQSEIGDGVRVVAQAVVAPAQPVERLVVARGVVKRQNAFVVVNGFLDLVHRRVEVVLGDPHQRLGGVPGMRETIHKLLVHLQRLGAPPFVFGQERDVVESGVHVTAVGMFLNHGAVQLQRAAVVLSRLFGLHGGFPGIELSQSPLVLLHLPLVRLLSLLVVELREAHQHLVHNLAFRMPVEEILAALDPLFAQRTDLVLELTDLLAVELLVAQQFLR